MVEWLARSARRTTVQICIAQISFDVSRFEEPVGHLEEGFYDFPSSQVEAGRDTKP